MLIDLANKLCDVEKFLDFILCQVLLKIVLFYEVILERNLLNEIQFSPYRVNGTSIHWGTTLSLSSLNIFEENKFYEIKKRNI